MRLLYAYKVIVAAVGLSFLSACASIPGSGMPESVRMYKGVKADKDIVKFIVPADLNILQLDGKEFNDSPNLSDGEYRLELLPGQHRFKVNYSKIWGSDALGNLVESDVFFFDVSSAAGSGYNFKHNGPTDMDASEWSDIGDIKIWLEEQKTAKKITAASVNRSGNILSRIIFGGDKTPEPEVVTKNTAVKMDVKQVEQNSHNAKELDNVQQKANQQLQFWWKIADKEQRNTFQRWLVTLKETSAAKADVAMQQKALQQLKFWWKLADIKQRESFLLWVEK